VCWQVSTRLDNSLSVANDIHSLLANREMYTIYLRLLSAFSIECVEAEGGAKMETHPVRGVTDPTQLVAVPVRYKINVVPRDLDNLRKTLAEDVEETA
jgi:3-hydroxyphenylacetate 6-hydroxylase